MPILFRVKSKPSWQTLSSAFDMSKKIDLASTNGLQSCVIASEWFTHESDGRNPDWFGFSSFSSNRKLQILLKIIFSNIFPKMGKREIAQQLLTNCLAFFLCAGIILDIFQISK